MKMNWNNLENRKCPVCGYDLLAKSYGGYFCPRADGFKIAQERYDSLVRSKYARSTYMPYLEALANARGLSR